MPESWNLAQSLWAAMHGFVAQLLAFSDFHWSSLTNWFACKPISF